MVHLIINGTKIDTTEKHPFWVIGKGWVKAGELKAGNKVSLKTGEIGNVDSVEVEELDEPVKVYNFEVEDWHTYFVSDIGVLVHNKCWVDADEATRTELPGRNGALNQAKKDANILRTQHPDDIKSVMMTEAESRGGHAITDANGKVVYTRQYEYTNRFGEKVFIQEHVYKHVGSDGPHFNVRPEHDLRTGVFEGTKAHYPFKK